MVAINHETSVRVMVPVLPLPSCALDREARSELLHMMGLVAVVVAVVILVFFGLGYLFGRLFL
jgi:hypothetical protein